MADSTGAPAKGSEADRKLLSTLRERGVKPSEIISWAAESAGLLPAGEKVNHVDEVVSYFNWSVMNQEDVVVESRWIR